MRRAQVRFLARWRRDKNTCNTQKKTRRRAGLNMSLSCGQGLCQSICALSDVRRGLKNLGNAYHLDAAMRGSPPHESLELHRPAIERAGVDIGVVVHA
jgi:hypothetical protein